MTEKSLLDTINGPDDVKKLRPDELPQLCGEIRQKLIGTVSQNGGHLASNLGTVELTVALHRIFSSPKDQIVWDVSHQSYTHKLLTGRAERFDTLRQLNGISGFSKPCESVHDVFSWGHSSTSISAAFGLAKAKSLQHDDGYVVAVIGDGSLTGGLAYEGMNNAGRSHDRLIVILNDNEMSISKNVGAMARHLAIIRAKPIYFRIKDRTEAFVSHIPFIGRWLRDRLFRVKSMLKNALYHSTIFEEMGFAYLGPADGHSIPDIERLLRRAKDIRRPTLIHLMTVKGKGYAYAEKNPGSFHGVGCFDVDSGEIPQGGGNSFSDVFGRTLCGLAEQDERVCAITAAMTQGTGLAEFAERFPARFFDVGIAEEHATVFAAGLAKNGMNPVFAVYSSFFQRAYDQVLHDVALQKLPVVFAVDRAGVVGEDGETHQGLFDAAFLNTVPGMTVWSPACADELAFFLSEAVRSSGPTAVRYPRGCEPALPDDFTPSFGCADFYGDGNAQAVIVTYGRLFGEACDAVAALRQQSISAAVLKLNRIRPVDASCIAAAGRFKRVFFFEEGIRSGGVGENFGGELAQAGYKGAFRLFAVNDTFVKQGTVKQLLHILGLDAQDIAESVVREWGA